MARRPEQYAGVTDADLFLAVSPEGAEVSGGYFVECGRRQPSAAARDDATAGRLWERSEELVDLDDSFRLSPAAAD